MGQYYKAVILNSKKQKTVMFAVSWDFGSGAKLMEHSWMLNGFVGAFEQILVDNPQPVVWAGDYANEEKCGNNIYTLCDSATKIAGKKDSTSLPKKFKYLINHDKKVFVDKTKTPLDSDGGQIHPLPLLTCEGNGLGGGDFRGNDYSELVGSWSRDIISVTSRKSDIPKGFSEIIINFTE